MSGTVLKYRSYPSDTYAEPGTVPIINRMHSCGRSHIKSSARDNPASEVQKKKKKISNEDTLMEYCSLRECCSQDSKIPLFLDF